jgi:hypothetical protein
MSLDTVVFEDGETVGPDESRTFDFLKGHIGADRFLRDSIAAQLQGRKSHQEITAWLRSHLDRPFTQPTVPGPAGMDWYDNGLRTMSREYIEQFGTLRDSDKLLRLVRQPRDRDNLNLHKKGEN